MADEFNLSDLVDQPQGLPEPPELLKRSTDEPAPAPAAPAPERTEFVTRPTSSEMPFDPNDLQDPAEHIKEEREDMYRRAREGDPTVHQDDLAELVYQDNLGTTPVSRALSKFGTIAKTIAKVEMTPITMAKSMLQGKGAGAGIPEEVKGVVGHVLDLDKRLAGQAQQDRTLGAQMTTDMILGGGTELLNFIGSTADQAATGLRNIAGQVTGEDPKKQAERIASSMIFQGEERRLMDKDAEALGANTKSPAYELGQNVGPFLMPGGGAGVAKISKGIAKIAEALPAAGVKNAARIATVSKALAKNPVMHGLVAEAVTGGLTSGVVAGAVSGGIKKALKSAVAKRIIKFATEATDEAVKLPEMPSVSRILRQGDSERTIIENIQQAQRTVMEDLKAKRAASLEGLSLDDKVAVVAKLPSGALAHDITELSKGAKTVRQIDEAIASMDAKMNRTQSLAKTNKLLSEGIKSGIRVSGAVAVAGGIGGLFGSLNDNPASDEGAASGAAFGSMLGSLGALHASKAGRLAVQGDRAFAKGIAHLKKSGVDISHLTPDVQRRIAIANGIVSSGGYKLVPISDAAYRKKFNLPDGVETPNGHYEEGSKTAYIVEESLNSGTLWHEGSHVMDSLSGDIITTAYTDMLRGTKNPEVHQAFKEFADRYREAAQKSDRGSEGLTDEELHAEGAAELVRYILQRTPMEELYGGRSFGSTIANKIKKATSTLKGGKTDVMRIPYFDAPYTPDMVSGMMDALYDIGAKSKAESFTVKGQPAEIDLAIRPDVRAAVKKYGDQGFINAKMQEQHLIDAQQALGPDATPEEIVGRAHDMAIGAVQPVKDFKEVAGPAYVEPAHVKSFREAAFASERALMSEYWKLHAQDRNNPRLTEINNQLKAMFDSRGKAKLMAATDKEIGVTAPNVITSNEVKGTTSRPVSYDEFLAIRARGKAALQAMRDQKRRSMDGFENPQRWNDAMNKGYASVQKEWGGATINPETGAPINLVGRESGGPYAMTAKDVGQKTIEVPIGADQKAFNEAMTKAKEAFPQLESEDHYLGVFRDENKGTIDFDPVIILDTLDQVESIGAHTRAIGGAYDYKTGDGYYPPHLDPQIGRAPAGPKLASGAWDSLFVEGEGQAKRAEIAKKIGVPEDEFYVRQKEADQQKILEHFKSTGEAQYMPNVGREWLDNHYKNVGGDSLDPVRTKYAIRQAMRDVDSGKLSKEDYPEVEKAILGDKKKFMPSPAGELKWMSRHYDMNPDQLEQFLIFGRAVAGHASKDRAPQIERMMTDLLETHGGTSPIAALQKLNETEGGIEAFARKHGFGPYGQNVEFLKHLAENRLPDLKNITEEELTRIPHIGPKTARFFKGHTDISRGNNVMLDTHILRFLRETGYPDAPHSTPQDPKVYEKWSKVFRDTAEEFGLLPSDLDLQIWLDRSGNMPRESYKALEEIGANRMMPATFDPNFVQKPPMPDVVLERAMKIAYPTNRAKTDLIGAHRKFERGTPLDVRIDIPTYNSTGLYSQTLHLPGIGKVQGYDSIVHLDGPITFAMNETMAGRVKEGGPKSPFAVVKGKFNPARDLPPDINNLQEWTPVGIDPKKHSYPYDKETHTPVIGGSQAVMIDNTAYIKDAEFGNKADFKYMPQTLESGEQPWSARLKELSDKDWSGGKITPAEEKELIDLHKKASDEYGSYANWFEKQGGEKQYTEGVFGAPKPKLVTGNVQERLAKAPDTLPTETLRDAITGAQTAMEQMRASSVETKPLETALQEVIDDWQKVIDSREKSVTGRTLMPHTPLAKAETVYKEMQNAAQRFIDKTPYIQRFGKDEQGLYHLQHALADSLGEAGPQRLDLQAIKEKLGMNTGQFDVLADAFKSEVNVPELRQRVEKGSFPVEEPYDFNPEKFRQDMRDTAEPQAPKADEWWKTGEEPPAIKLMPGTEKEMPAYIESYQQKYPDARPIEFMKNKEGEYRFPKNSQTKKNEAVPRTYEYDLENTPLAEAAKKGAKDDKEARVRAVKAYSEKVKIEAEKALAVPEVAAARGWYRVFKDKIQTKLDAMGLGEHVDKFMEIVSATSPQNDPWNNFMYAIDAWNKWRKGEYDSLIGRYHEEYAKFLNGELTTPNGKKMESVGQFEDHLGREGISPTRLTKEGKEGKFGKNGPKTMHALAGTFLDTAGKLKIHQFVHNLLQKDLNATIDMWAARTLHRVGWEGSGNKQWRLLPFQESGVTDLDFRLGQDVFREVAKQLDMSTDDLQALMWFHEKKLWYDKGYSAKLDYGDFRPLVDYAHPEEGGTFRYEPDLKAYRAATGTQKK